MKWHSQFDERQQREISFSQTYTRYFKHGTDGHNAKLIIAKMQLILDHYEHLLDTHGVPVSFEGNWRGGNNAT